MDVANLEDHMNLSRVNMICSEFERILSTKENRLWNSISKAVKKYHQTKYPFNNEKGVLLDDFYYNVCIVVEENFIRIILPHDGILYHPLKRFEKKEENIIISPRDYYHNVNGWAHFTYDQMKFFPMWKEFFVMYLKKQTKTYLMY